ncbi:hypothetical protein BJ878DRAFT_98475 [Calycina marina]|uniref:HIT-type domain-containing protein n=1 Tax=Calycina marina TaxID=1763456 RepID=A0A9P7Z2V4_9HELO|nr:hypothetical protein BJ878DRAFT_98475 [Calycina marina]
MDNLLLESLCRICNIHAAKYTCPRCYFPTCSLPCARRHKLRASCNGERDQTAFKPMSLLATPSGIDHDYNFLHAIETRVQRSEKLIVEEKSLVEDEELRLARTGEEDRAKHRRKHGAQSKGEEPIQRSLRSTQTSIIRAPRGMIRNLENETSWSKRQKSINWQVEWLREGEAGRVLAKIVGNVPIGEQYATIRRLENRTAIQDDDTANQEPGGKRKRPMKRAAANKKQRQSRERKALPYTFLQLADTMLQDPKSTAWRFMPSAHIPQAEPVLRAAPKDILPPTVGLFLLRPQTPSNFPKVLVPINPLTTFETLLYRRTVLEFPTIHVFEQDTNQTPDGFILEKDFMVAKSQLEAYDTPSIEEELGSADNESTSSEEDTEASDSGPDSDGSVEEEEVVPKVWRSTR